MLVYVHRDTDLYYCPIEIDEGSLPRQREQAVEVPDELVARHIKAQDEYGEVQDLLRDIWERI